MVMHSTDTLSWTREWSVPVVFSRDKASPAWSFIPGLWVKSIRILITEGAHAPGYMFSLSSLDSILSSLALFDQYAW